MAFTKETLIEIWNDETGDRIDVGPDRDGLDLCEIRAHEGQGIIHRISMQPQQAVLVAEAILELFGEKYGWKKDE